MKFLRLSAVIRLILCDFFFVNHGIKYDNSRYDTYMKKIAVLLFPLMFVFAACHHTTLPSGVMNHGQMVDFLADAYLLEGFYAVETQYRYDVMPTQVARSYDSILDLHGLTRDDVEHSIDFYSRHLDEYEAIHNEVVARLEAERDSL